MKKRKQSRFLFVLEKVSDGCYQTVREQCNDADEQCYVADGQLMPELEQRETEKHDE